MTDEDKTRQELILELKELRRRLAALGADDTVPEKQEIACEVGISQSRTAENRKSDRSFRVSEDLLRAFTQAAFQGFVFTKKGCIIEANRQFAEIFGYEYEEVIGKKLKQFLAPEEHGRAWRVFRTDKEHAGEYLGVKKDGTIIVFEANKWIMEQKNRLLCLSSIKDITERKQMEEALSRIRDELEVRVRERTAELGEANEELRMIPGRLIAAQENERKRIAGELHDSVGQTLAALKFHIEHISITLKSGKTQAALELVERLIPVFQRSIDETRAIYMGLRPRMLEDMGILVTLRWFCREMQNLYPAMHIEPEIDIEENDVPEPLKIAIFRITQEALNNAAKYSKAEWVDLALTGKDGVVRLAITDEGIGMDLDYIIQSSTAKSLGLTGMKERAELTGGKFSITSAMNEGTTVEAVWRLTECPAPRH